MIFVASRGLQSSPIKTNVQKPTFFTVTGRGGVILDTFSVVKFLSCLGNVEEKEEKKTTVSLLVAKENFRKMIESKKGDFLRR